MLHFGPRDADDLVDENHRSPIAVTGRDEGLDPVDDLRWCYFGSAERRLIEHKAADVGRQQDCVQRTELSDRVAHQMDRRADHVYDGSHVLEIALDLIVMAVRIALATATPVNPIRGELFGKHREDQPPRGMAIPAAVNEDERRPYAGPVVRDPRAVAGRTVCIAPPTASSYLP
jgi:hypothetical protein